MGWMIGVDLGGTNLRAAQVHPTGAIGVTRQVPVDHDDSHPTAPFLQVTKLLAEMVRSVDNDRGIGSLDAIGISVTGPIDPVTGWVDNPYTLPAAMQGDLLGAVRSVFDVPIVVDNDANAAALGEARFGAGRDGDVVICVTVGTGIGVGIVAHGHLYEGAQRSHQEPGHLVIDPSGPACYCGASGCIESLASASAVVDAAVDAGIVVQGASALDVHRLADAGDATARHVVDDAMSSLAAGIRTLVAVYAPDVVVLAGNAQGDTDRLVRIVQDTVDRFPFGADNVSVRPAELGNWAGCVGVASLAVDRLTSGTGQK
jgi:glucokinase